MTCTPPRGLFHSGEWFPTAASTTLLSPTDGGPVALMAACTVADVATAVGSARSAADQGVWAATVLAERAAVLAAAAELLRSAAFLAAKTELLDTGVTLADASAEVAAAAAALEAAPDEPPGGATPAPAVHALLTGTVQPLLAATVVLAPLLRAGATVVLHPAPTTPSGAVLLVELLAAAGLPAGVANLVTGADAVVGAALLADPRVDVRLDLR